MLTPSHPLPSFDPFYTFRSRKILHPHFKSTINDLFKKLDLKINGVLTSSELKQFGELINDDKIIQLSKMDMGPDI